MTMNLQDQWIQVLAETKLGLLRTLERKGSLDKTVDLFQTFVQTRSGWLRTQNDAVIVVNAWNDFASQNEASDPDRIKLTVEHLLNCIDAAIASAAQREPPLTSTKTVSNTFNVTGASSSIQVGDGNVQFVQLVQGLQRAIDEAHAYPEQKASATSLLRKLIEHPLINTILGVGAGSILK